MTDLRFRTTLGLNQPTYDRLRLSLELNLRRQIFIAVCDDLVLRDRLVQALESELVSESNSEVPYPCLVSLNLNLRDPNPIAQITRWLKKNLPTQSHQQDLAVPAFQFLGVEHLTRQSAIVQRLFFTYLQEIERRLPILESSLLFWMPRPWYIALEESAPEFWRSRTAVFEFLGEPTPLTIDLLSDRPSVDSLDSLEPQDDSDPLDSLDPASAEPPVKPIPSKPPLEELRLEERVAEPVQEQVHANPPEPTLAFSQTELWQILNHDLRQFEPLVEPPTEVAPTSEAVTKTAAVSPIQPPSGDTSETRQRDRIPERVPAVQTTDRQNSPDPRSRQSGTLVKLAPLIAEPIQSDDPQSLNQQIERLHQQQASPTVLANAYRALGNCHRDRVEHGNASIEDIQLGIQAYEQVLVWLHDQSSLWVDVLNDLGNLYWMLSRRSPTPAQALSHLQPAIQVYLRALNQINIQTQLASYTMLQNNLGAAYSDLARYEDPAENLQRSILAYQQALRYRKPEVDPLRYALTQNNLGTTYWNLAQHQQPKEHLKQAIAAYSEALRYYRPETDPLNHAMIQNNLGTAYWNLSQHERPQDWLMLALGAYRMALRYRTLEKTPVAYAATQNNLGTAYWHMANHSKNNPDARLDYLQQAIASYSATILAANQLIAQHQATPEFSVLNFDLYATYNNLALAHHQLAIDYALPLLESDRLQHLEIALEGHLRALHGWSQKPNLRQATLGCVSRTIRAFYEQGGIKGQNHALSRVPGHLLPEILPQLA